MNLVLDLIGFGVAIGYLFALFLVILASAMGIKRQNDKLKLFLKEKKLIQSFEDWKTQKRTQKKKGWILQWKP